MQGPSCGPWCNFSTIALIRLWQKFAFSTEQSETMKTICRNLCVCLLMLLVFVGCDAASPRQCHEKTGGFSYNPPSGWKVAEFPGLKYRIAHGQAEKDFTPNINITDEAFAGTLAEYADANVQNLNHIFPNLQILSRTELTTKDNEPVVRIIATNEPQGRMLRQTFFLIGSGDRNYAVTCTALADNGDKFDTIFTESLLTFRIHR